MKITIDPYAGFCFGVERAIRIAEDNLFGDIPLKSLGDIVHNEQENKRLNRIGLRTIPREVFYNLKHGRVLFRAHGEDPESYKIACRNNTRVIDATCPVVKKLQSRIAKSSKEVQKKHGLIIIFGKRDHPEVIGLLGHTAGQAVVISTAEEVSQVDLPPVIRMFAQTTRGVDEFLLLQDAVRRRLGDLYDPGQVDFKSFNTICKQVSGRENYIKEFAAQHDVVIFVAGKESSNGKLLFSYVTKVNNRSYYISSPDEIMPRWFKDAKSAGITGATSTPSWLMEEVGKNLEKL
jgi:4-hydroxy-3-methylbut-2-enyl diphosphate reductase